MESIDTLLTNGFKIVQDKEKFCYGIDAILLANFVAAAKYETAFDLGTGNGIIPILLAATKKAGCITGIEIQRESAELAKKSVNINGQENQITIINGDIKNIEALAKKASIDCVTSNPPYIAAGSGRQNPANAKNIARHEILCTLDDVIKAAAYLLKQNRDFFMIHKPSRTTEIFERLAHYKLTAKRLQFVHPFVDQPPTMVLVQAQKNARPLLTVEKPLIVYSSKGVYTNDIKAIYATMGINAKI